MQHIVRDATNDYFHNQLICRLFFQLINDSDKKKKKNFQTFNQKRN